MKLVAIDKNLKAQKNAQDRIIKKGKALLNAFLKKEANPKKLRDGYGYKFDINPDWRLFSEDLKMWLIIDHLEYNRHCGVKGAHK
ncbi:hypothetical protein [Escherichia coli]|uniref:ParE family toxin-like protein n=1 Tax=Escherichia coli TaxID=562 RepID=UPI0023EB94FD|nr:hypothetical protein [Escherichia coli]